AQRLGVSEATAATVVTPMEEEPAPMVPIPAAVPASPLLPMTGPNGASSAPKPLVNSKRVIPTVSPLLIPGTSPNTLLLQSLPNSIPYQQDDVRRRNDAHRVGTAARGSLERLSRLPRRLPSDGGASGRVRRALSTRSGDRGQRAPRAPLPPGVAVPSGAEECGKDCHLYRCRAPGHPRLYRHGALGSSAFGCCVSRTSRRAVGRI